MRSLWPGAEVVKEGVAGLLALRVADAEQGPSREVAPGDEAAFFGAALVDGGVAAVFVVEGALQSAGLPQHGGLQVVAGGLLQQGQHAAAAILALALPARFGRVHLDCPIRCS